MPLMITTPGEVIIGFEQYQKGLIRHRKRAGFANKGSSVEVSVKNMQIYLNLLN